MPSFQGQIDEGQMIRLLAYLKSLSVQTGSHAMTDVTVVRLPDGKPANYLEEGHTVASWLTTTDHKRIAILYALSITAFFFIGGIAIGIVRLELITPQGNLLTDDQYNRLFTLHGIVMVWFFLVPSIPTTLRQFSAADDDRRARRRLPAAQSVVLVPVRDRRRVHHLFGHRRRRRHRLDLLYAVLDFVLQQPRHRRGRRRVRRRIFLDRHRRQFHHHHAHAARARA